jgi:hypothetical protein
MFNFVSAYINISNTIYTVHTCIHTVKQAVAGMTVSNPSSVPQGYVNSYSTLPWGHMGGSNRYAEIPWWGLRYTLANRAKVKGIMLKAVWHWGSDCGVINNPLGEPGSTPLYGGLPPTWGSVDRDQMFSVFPFLGNRKDIGRTRDRHHSLWGPRWWIWQWV